MPLNGNEIEKLVKQNNLIENFKPENLSSASYDISLSDTILVLSPTSEVIELSDIDAIENCYQKVVISENGYEIKPRESILAVLQEKIHIPNFLCSHIRPRTSISRLGLFINFQHINAGYEGTLNLTLMNASPNTYRLRPNMRIGQIVFELLTTAPSDPLLYPNERHPVYQHENGQNGSKIYADFIGKVFRHFKGNYYFIENISMDSETKENVVVYRPLYHREDSMIWTRPASMFFEKIDPNRPDNITGQKYRFELVEDLEKDYTKKENE